METGKPGPRIGVGRTAEIFAWGHDRILKLIRPEFPGRLADEEAAITTAVREAGIRASARILDLQIPPEMIEAHRLRDDVLAALARLPDGDAVCHGDLHPGNIIMSSQGPVVIDWIDASRGHPFGDVARSVLLLRHSVLPRDMSALTRRLLQVMRSAFTRRYLDRYLRQRSAAEGEHDRLAPRGRGGADRRGHPRRGDAFAGASECLALRSERPRTRTSAMR